MKSEENTGGKFGETVNIGWILGEEIMYHEDEHEKCKRIETCVSRNESCFLQISAKELVNLKDVSSGSGGGGGSTLQRDFYILMNYIEQNHAVKTIWREEAKLIEKKPEPVVEEKKKKKKKSKKKDEDSLEREEEEEENE